jgi:hypothetical protein
MKILERELRVYGACPGSCRSSQDIFFQICADDCPGAFLRRWDILLENRPDAVFAPCSRLFLIALTTREAISRYSTYLRSVDEQYSVLAWSNLIRPASSLGHFGSLAMDRALIHEIRTPANRSIIEACS